MKGVVLSCVDMVMVCGVLWCVVIVVSYDVSDSCLCDGCFVMSVL